jgi:hypothetical protein
MAVANLIKFENVFSVFTDLKGEPLEDGYIYIGQENKDPVSNQITIYWDENLSIAAGQPVRTLAGYPDYNGSPGNLYSNVTNYSIKVLNKKRELVFESLSNTGSTFEGSVNNVNTMAELLNVNTVLYSHVNVSGFYSASDGGGGLFHWNSTASKTTHDGGTVIDPDIGVTPGAAGWWAAPASGTGVRERQDIKESFIVNWFGAHGDGVNSDTEAYNGAYAANKYVEFLSGTYLFSTMPDPVSVNGSRIIGNSYKQGGTRIEYTQAIGVLFDITGDSCEIGGIWIYGPGTAGTDVAVKFNASWRNALRNVRIEECYTAFYNSGTAYDNVVEYFFITRVARGLHWNGGSSATVRNGYIANGTSTIAASRCIYLESITHISIKDVKFAEGFIYGLFIDSVNSVTLTDCHFEQSNSTAPAENDIRMTSTLTQINIIGGRIGHPNLSAKTIRFSTSGGNSNNLFISNARVISNANGLFDDQAGSYIVAHGTDVQSSDLANSLGTFFLLSSRHTVGLDENGNFTSPATVQGLNVVSRDGYLQTSNFYARRYSLRKTNVQANTSTDFFKSSTTNGIITGIVQIAAVRIASSEQSFKHYQVYADQSGTQVDLIGTGRDSGATVSLSITRSGTDVTFTVNTAVDWAGDDIFVNVMADLTSYAVISFTDL